MGLFGKIKNIFYDEEIIEVPVEEKKQEERPRVEEVKIQKREEQRPVIRPVVEEEKPVAPVYTERELFKTESTFKFPVIDEDEDEEPILTRTRNNALDLERKQSRESIVKPEVKNTFRSINTNTREVSSSSNSGSNGTKTFRPSPVISPVYGVLDKNYKKEEIIERQHHAVRHNPSDMNYDSIRRKAYGTLEDELENTLSKISSSKTQEVMQTIEEVESLDTEANSKSIEELLSEIEGNKNVSIGEIEERIKDRLEEEDEGTDSFVKQEDEFIRRDSNGNNQMSTEEKQDEKKEDKDEFDKTLEHDLFNLIDSMYEEREGE